MYDIPEADSFIKIGFKAGKMILVDWSDLFENFTDKESEEVINEIVDCLKLAILFITKS
jgi:hypothetical protein